MSNEDKAADKVVADCYDCADLSGLEQDIQKLVYICNARVTVFGPEWEVRLVKFQELRALLTAATDLLSETLPLGNADLMRFKRLESALLAFKEFE